MTEEILVSPSGCVEMQRTIGELINQIQQEENKIFYQECLKIQIDPEALLKCEKEILELRERIKKLQKERDAAVKDMKEIKACEACKHFCDYPFDIPCRECYLGAENSFEWRSVDETLL